MAAQTYTSILCILLLVVFVYINNAQKCPAFSVKDETKEDIAKVNGSTVRDEGYPENVAKRLSRNKVYGSNVREAKKTLQFCKTRYNFPTFPSFPRISDVCPVGQVTITIPYTVFLGGRKCYVLSWWAGQKCNYVYCKKWKCDVIQPKPIHVPGAASFNCRPTNYKKVKVYAICPNRPPRRWVLKYFFIGLPQCCSCFKYQC